MNQRPLALWNGELQPLADVRVSVLDRAYLFGDAAYEVLRLYAGKPFLLAEHEARFARSLHELDIPMPAGDLGAKIQRLVDASGQREGTVYVQVSRGEGPRTHVPPPGLRPNELLFLGDIPPAVTAKSDGGISALVLPDLRWGRCDIKSTNLLGNILAAAEAKRRGFDEAILVDAEGFVTEGAHTTFFGVRGGALVTTPLSPAILPGITRDFVVGLAKKHGLEVIEERVAAPHLGRFDEMFLTGTVSELFPVVRFTDDEGALTGPTRVGAGETRNVGDGKPGPVTRRLLSLYRAAVPK